MPRVIWENGLKGWDEESETQIYRFQGKDTPVSLQAWLRFLSVVCMETARRLTSIQMKSTAQIHLVLQFISHKSGLSWVLFFIVTIRFLDVDHVLNDTTFFFVVFISVTN